MASARENKDFTDAILPSYPLDEAIDWIAKNMEPEDVFSPDDLRQWAENSGWVLGDGD